MKCQYSLLSHIFVLFASFVLLQTCSDSASTDEPGPSPEVPQLEAVSIDDSYFQENNPENPEDEEFTAYLISQEGITVTAQELLTILELPEAVFSAVSNAEVSEEDGVWTWEFMFTILGEMIDEEGDLDAETRVTAQPGDLNNETSWSVFFTIDESPYGPMDNFNAFNVTVNQDESEGTIELFDPENPDTRNVDLSWTMSSADEKSISINAIEEGENGDQLIEITYTESGPEFTLSFVESMDEATQVLISWNTETGSGSIDTPDGLFCWDNTLRMTEC